MYSTQRVKPMVEVNCPKCSEKFNVEAAVCVPPTQQLTMKLELSSEMIAARTLGLSIINMRKLLVSVAKDIGAKVEVLVHKLQMDGRSVEIGYTIVAVGQQPTEGQK
jgi:hypothetical protein